MKNRNEQQQQGANRDRSMNERKTAEQGDMTKDRSSDVNRADTDEGMATDDDVKQNM